MCKYIVSQLDFYQFDTRQGHLGRRTIIKKKCLHHIGKSVKYFLIMVDVGVQTVGGNATWGR